LVLALCAPSLALYEQEQGLVRGQPGSERAGRILAECYPDPGRVGAPPVAAGSALLHEAAGTAWVVLVVGWVTHPGRVRRRWQADLAIALAVAVAIVVVAPVTQAGLNPARDLGPRLVAWAAGFGAVALPGPAGGWWVYVAGPLLGGTLAAMALRTLAGRKERA
jgi:glycerol uptake facilitator-like aquaporin